MEATASMNGLAPRALIVCALGLGCLYSRRGAAQATTGFALDQFEPSERGSDWFVSDSLDLRGRTRPVVGATAGWAYRPLIAISADGTSRGALVSDQATLYLGGTLTVVDRVRFGIDLPVVVYGTGDSLGSLAATDSFAAGDLRLGADARLFGDYGKALTVAAGAQVFLPTGSPGAYASDGAVRLRPRLLAAGELGRFIYAAGVAFEYRGERWVAGTTLGSGVLFFASAGAHALVRTLTLGPEIVAGTVVTGPDGAFGARNTPVEAMVGGHYTASSLRFGLGGGPGLTRGVGSPAWRLLASFEWTPEYGEGDRDGDRIADVEDACPDARGPRSSNPKMNGCPPDRDRDSIADAEDACPDVPGVASPEPMRNGCPPDRDGDGVPDPEDACPEVAGVHTADPKTDGCPADPDRDHDGIANEADACPDASGPANADPKKNGCPLAFVEGALIRITDQVQFRTGTAVLDPSAEAILTAVKKILADHPEIVHVEVQGHTDSTGNAARNQRLSENRANSVRRWLVSHGVASAGVSSLGFGSTRPLVSNEDEEGRRQNRRVEFHIDTEGAPGSKAREN
jgi:OmpA-OmpF porin, OOP family